MLTRVVVQGLRQTAQCRRHLSISAVAAQKAATASDPIQKLFLDKIHEYSTKSKTAEAGLVDCTADARKVLTDELDKIARVYGATGADFMKFPTFTFQDPVLEAVGVEGKARDVAGVTEGDDSAAAEEEDKPYWEP